MAALKYTAWLVGSTRYYAGAAVTAQVLPFGSESANQVKPQRHGCHPAAFCSGTWNDVRWVNRVAYGGPAQGDRLFEGNSLPDRQSSMAQLQPWGSSATHLNSLEGETPVHTGVHAADRITNIRRPRIGLTAAFFF